MTTRSASDARAVASKPACSRSPAIRSESWTFIWQPKVSIRYLRATFAALPFVSFVDLRVLVSEAAFAFALRLSPLHQHLTGGGPDTIAHPLAAEHARELVDAAGVVEPSNRRARPPALDALLDREMRVGCRRDLRQVRDAQHLERRSERPQRAADDVGDAAADAGVHFVEDETGRRSARRPIAGLGEAVARSRGERLDPEHDPRELPARHDARQRP